jgi:hypothetical protein
MTGKVPKAWTRGVAAIALAAMLAAGCGFTSEDTSPRGKAIILAVQTHRLPLGMTVADGVANYIYSREQVGDEIRGRTWHAFKRVTPGEEAYRVVFRFDRVAHGDVPVTDVGSEIRFLYNADRKTLEPENNLARLVTRSR